jgi:hypothetical protein
VPATTPYPAWKYYPPRNRPPSWVEGVTAAFSAARTHIGSGAIPTKSDEALAAVRDDLVALGFQVEAGKKRAQKIRRPVLFGEYGREERSYEIDAFHPDLGIALEVPPLLQANRDRPVRTASGALGRDPLRCRTSSRSAWATGDLALAVVPRVCRQ